MRERITKVAAFGAIYLFWGSTYLAIAVGLRTIPPFLLMGARCLFGGAILLTLARFRNRERPSTMNWQRAAISGIFFFLGCHGILAFAEKSISSGFAAVVLATIPFWIVLVEYFFPARQKPSRAVLLSLIPGFAGVALIAWKQIQVSSSHFSYWTVVLLLCSSLSWALGTVVAARLKSGEDRLSFTGMELLFGAAALSVISVTLREPARFELAAVSFASWMALTFLVVAGTVVAFGAYIWLLQSVSTPIVATYTFVNPIIAVFLGWLFLNEQLNWIFLVGLGLVVISIVNLCLQESRRSTSSR
jgi:drug/metabolite transporter (DMT)-like permease